MWRGTDSDRLGESLVDVLGGTREVSEPDEEDEDRAWWPLARDVINIFMETEGVSQLKYSTYLVQSMIDLIYFSPFSPYPSPGRRSASPCTRSWRCCTSRTGWSGPPRTASGFA